MEAATSVCLYVMFYIFYNFEVQPALKTPNTHSKIPSQDGDKAIKYGQFTTHDR